MCIFFMVPCVTFSFKKKGNKGIKKYIKSSGSLDFTGFFLIPILFPFLPVPEKRK